MPIYTSRINDSNTETFSFTRAMDASETIDFIVGSNTAINIGNIGGNTPLALTIIGDSNNNPVPEPSTMMLLYFGLIGLVGVRRKFRK